MSPDCVCMFKWNLHLWFLYDVQQFSQAGSGN